MKKYFFCLAGVAFFSWSTSYATIDEGQDTPTAQPSQTVTLCCKAPQYLKAGDKVALISPSYHTPMENVTKTASLLRSWGLEPVIGPHVGEVYLGKYAGTVEERLSDLRWALTAPDIKAIICNRGGYGSIHLIDELELPELSSNPKWIVGYSDISTLHGLMARAGVMSIHGTMSAHLANNGQDMTSQLMLKWLMGQVPRYEMPAHPQNILGRAQGVLVGGNLCTIVPNVGTIADATVGEGIILFIEEVEESMHNVDRQLNVLRMHGVLNRCRGVILGEFTECGSEFTCESVEAMLRPYFEPYHIPVLCGFPAGHGDVNLPLAMGAMVTIDVRADGAAIQFDIPGEQQLVRITE